jgi:hypothetical protein
MAVRAGAHLDFALPFRVRQAKLDRLSGQDIVKYSQLAENSLYRDWHRTFAETVGTSVTVSSIHEKLRRYDLNRVDSVDGVSFVHALRKAGVQLGTDRLRALFADLDVRASGRVDIEMFCSLVEHWRISAAATENPRPAARRTVEPTEEQGQPALDLGDAIGSFELQDTLRMLLERRGDFLKACAQLAPPPRLGQPVANMGRCMVSTADFWMAARHVGVSAVLGIGQAMDRFATRVGAIDEDDDDESESKENSDERTWHNSFVASPTRQQTAMVNPNRLLDAALAIFKGSSTSAAAGATFAPPSSFAFSRVPLEEDKRPAPPLAQENVTALAHVPDNAGLMRHAAKVWDSACRHLSRAQQRWDVLLAQSLSMRDLVAALAMGGLKLRDQDQHTLWRDLHRAVHGRGGLGQVDGLSSVVKTVPTSKSPLRFGEIDAVLRDLATTHSLASDENMAPATNNTLLQQSLAGAAEASYDPYLPPPPALIPLRGDTSMTAAGERTKTRLTHLRAGAMVGERHRRTSPFATHGTFQSLPSQFRNDSGELPATTPTTAAGAYPRREVRDEEMEPPPPPEMVKYAYASSERPPQPAPSPPSSPPRRPPPYAVTTSASNLRAASQVAPFDQPATRVGKASVLSGVPDGAGSGYSYQPQHHEHRQPLWAYDDAVAARARSPPRNSNASEAFVAGSPSQKLTRAMGDKYGYSFPDASEMADGQARAVGRGRVSGSYYYEVERQGDASDASSEHPLATAPENFHNVSFPWPPQSGYDEYFDPAAAGAGTSKGADPLPPAGISSPPRRFAEGPANDPEVLAPSDDPERMPPVLRRLRALVHSQPAVRAELDAIFPETRSAYRHGLSRGEVQQGLQVRPIYNTFSCDYSFWVNLL